MFLVGFFWSDDDVDVVLDSLSSFCLVVSWFRSSSSLSDSSTNC